MTNPSTGVLQISQSGTYLCQGLTSYSLGAGAIQLNIFFAINGTPDFNTISEVTFATNENNVMSTGKIYSLNAGDTVSLMYNTSNDTLTTFNFVFLQVMLQGGTLAGPTGPSGPTGISDGWILLDNKILASPTGTINFNSISQAYNDLKIVSVCQDNSANNFDNITINYNGDTGSNYEYVQSYAQAGGLASNVINGTFDIMGIVSTATSDPASFSVASKTIFNYSSSIMWKHSLSNNYSKLYYSPYLFSVGGQWTNTNAITDISIGNDGSANFIVGSNFKLYARI